MIEAQFEKTFQGWRKVARDFLQKKIPPSEIIWDYHHLSLFTDNDPSVSLNKSTNQIKVSAEFLKLAEQVSYARDADRWDLLYRILFRIQHENPNLIKIYVDPDIARAMNLARSVSKDIHKMHAFVRFKKVMIESQEIYMAWHQTEHLIVKPATPFFARRFGDRPWSIFTADESAHWDTKQLTFGAGLEQNEFQIKDDWDEVWKAYYKSIFNPARIKIKMMKSEMSPKYWASMPETSLIHELVREAPNRLQKMSENHNQSAEVSLNKSLAELKIEIKSCQSCPLYKTATQPVFGHGSADAKLVIIGEQPGDQEDLQGLPFVGPAGILLADALQKADLKKEDIYITNAVKHFKWTPHKNRRLHQKPTGKEMHACKPWLDAELAQIKPKIILALGATAATAILGRLPKISEERGQVIYGSSIAEKIIISWHPSAILKSTDQKDSELKQQQLLEDLQLVQKNLKILLDKDQDPTNT